MVDLVLSGSADYMTHYAGLKHPKKKKKKEKKVAPGGAPRLWAERAVIRVIGYTEMGIHTLANVLVTGNHPLPAGSLHFLPF